MKVLSVLTFVAVLLLITLSFVTYSVSAQTNFTVTKTILSTNHSVGNFVEYMINITNNDILNITLITINDTYNSSHLAFNSSDKTPDNTGAGFVYWGNVTAGTLIPPGGQSLLYVNMTAIDSGVNVENFAEASATISNGTTGTLTNSVNVTINQPSNPPFLNGTLTKTTLNSSYTVNDMIEFFVNFTNINDSNVTGIFLTDEFNNSLLKFNSSYPVYDSANLSAGSVTWNITNLANGSSFEVLVNFTTTNPGGIPNNVAVEDANENNFLNGYGIANVSGGPPGGGGDNWDEGIDQWQSAVVSPYILIGSSKVINFSIYRMAGQSSCLDNITITKPSIYDFNGYNSTSTINNTFSVAGNDFLWSSTGSEFFCGQGPKYFSINVTTNQTNYTSDIFQITAFTNESSSSINKSILTTTTIPNYQGLIYDSNGLPLSGGIASVGVTSFSMDGDMNLGAFLGTTNATGGFSITSIPSLNFSMEEQPLFYQLTAYLYNDSTNKYAKYIGPSLPMLPEQEFVGMLSNPEIYLKPAITFKVQVLGFDFQSGPTNVNETCPGPSCPGWQPQFNVTNMNFGYNLKDLKLGYEVSSDFSQSSSERYVNAPRARNYSLMIFPSSSFPLSIDFSGASQSCNSTGANISQPGVEATCTTSSNDTIYLVDATINTTTSYVPLTGYVNDTNLTSLRVVAYMFEGGNIIFEDRTFPFNLGNIETWPKNDSYNDYYNLTSGFFNITLPATEATSQIMLRMYAKKGSTLYADSFKLTAASSTLSNTTHNFSLYNLISGENRAINSDDVSSDWNSTTVVNTTGVNFQFVNSSGSNLTNENSFVEIRRTLNGDEYLQMTNAQNGSFTISLLEGESLSKLTIYSQSYAPLSTPVSASVLSGGSNSRVSCSSGFCTITMKEFDPFDPDNPNASMNVLMDLYTSNSTCDVPNPPVGCSLTQGQNKSEFSPFNAIMKGDVSLRIRSGNISVHYTNTDLLASGPPSADFSQNATGDDLNAAWRFGSSGPEIYSSVLIGMPFSSSLENSSINITIPLLYDNDFNIVWNISNNNTANLTGTDYADYLNTSYESYLNGTGVSCNDTDATLSSNLCYKDTANLILWMKIPHFSGVGPEITGTNTTTPTTPTTPSSSSPSGGSSTSSSSTTTEETTNDTIPVKKKTTTSTEPEEGSSKKIVEVTETQELENNENLKLKIAEVLGVKSLESGTVKKVMEFSKKIVKNTNMTREIKSKNGTSTVTLTIDYKGNESINSFSVFDIVPKEFAQSAKDINVEAPGARIIIVNDDPEFLFVYDQVDKDFKTTIKYSVDNESSIEVLDDFGVELYGESSFEPDSEEQTQSSSSILPWILIFVLILATVGYFFFVNKKETKKKTAEKKR